MGSVSSLLRGANLSGEFNEFNSDLVAAITKLINIKDIFVDSYSNAILEVHVSPLNLIQTKMSDIDKLTVYVIYNINNKGDEIIDEAEDMLKALVSDEFDIKGKVSVEFHTTASWSEPTVLLYTIFPENALEQSLPTEIYWSFYELVCLNDYTVSFPISLLFAKTKGVYIHCASGDRVIALDKVLGSSTSCHAVEYSSKAKKRDKSVDYYYVPMIRQEAFQYSIPYVYVTKDSFDKQYLDAVLNSGQNQ